jgi:D-beta-D-heptose 7-phosphate kinase/D-beta-D-heptose 1-phosphate adenosyltransferase
MTVKGLDFSGAKVLVVGDVMLDQYWHGAASRISPEAPVPVVHINRVDERPGGAANVAIGVAALGATTRLLGLTGNDIAATILSNLLSKEGVDYYFEKIHDHHTITKLRVLSRNHQMIRLDQEKQFLQAVVALDALQDHYDRLLDGMEVVILSDYGKGTLAQSTRLIEKARAKNIRVLVDPKSTDFSIYRGASVITPNLKEFEAVVGACPNTDVLIQKAVKLLQEHQIESMVITRSEKGLSVIFANGETAHVPAVAREVHDVTGAGDTVVAVLGVALAAGMSLVDAASLGNIAAGIVVGKLGAATVTVAELESVLGKDENITLGVMSEESLLAAVRRSRAKGERIVFTNGCFDILHAGHVLYLEQAKRLGDRVIVAVNSDESISRLKGPTRPINPLENRLQVLSGLRSVDWVVPFSDDTPERLIKKIVPDIMVKGGDYQDLEALPGALFVLSQGGEVRTLGLKEGLSTTHLISMINNQAPETVIE